MKKKKFLSVALVAAMTASLLAGCGSGGSGDSGNGGNAGGNGGNAGSGDKVHINVYRATFNLAAADTNQVKKVEDAINAYLDEKGTNIEIGLTDVGSGEYTEKANLALANNEINLLWTASWESTIGTNDLVPNGAVYDITDLLPGTPLYNSMDADQWEATKYNGRNYYIPVYKDNVEGYDFMFRQDLIDKHNWDITSVKTLADLEPMLADAKADGLKYPLLTQKTAMFYRWYIDSFDFFTGDVTANWVCVDRDTNQVVSTIETPEYLEFCTLMADWAEKGYISEDDVTKTTTDTTTQTQDWAISWWTDIPVNDEADARYGQDVTMQPATKRWAHSTSALGSCYAVTANSTAEQAKACIDFMGLLYTDSKLADLYTFGIEGEDFVYATDGGRVLQAWVDDGGTFRAPGENEDPTNTSEKYNHSMWESASATIVTPLDNEPANKADLYKEFNGGAETSCAAGFRFDRSPVDAQFAACQSVFDEFGFVLENGGYAKADVESKIAEYKAALDEAGFQDILAEFQKQYDAFKAQ